MGWLAFLLAVLVGAAWGFAYGMGPAALAVWVGGHAVAGIGLALVLPPLARRLCPRAPYAGVALAVLLALVVAPALLDRLSFVDLSKLLRAAAIGGTATLAGLLGLLVARGGATAAALAGLAALAAAYFATAPEQHTLKSRPLVAVERGTAVVKRVAVLGIDGGDWRVIDPMIARGELPNLAKLRERGVHGVLESIDPMYSPVVWSSIFTGKVPEKHGITGWYVSHAANTRAARLWKLLEQAGLRSVVSGVPGTWPPVTLHGALVSGFPMPSPFEFAGGESLLVGSVVDDHERHGKVPTALATPGPDGSQEARVHLGDEALQTRVRLRHALIEWPQLRALFPAQKVFATVRVGSPADDGARKVGIDGQETVLRPGEWTPWLSLGSSGTPVRVRGRLMADGSVYLTPAFQDPRRPRHWFTSSPEVLAAVSAEGTYVVEGAGWRAAADADVRDPLFEHLADVAQVSYDALLRVIATVPDWELLAYVFTLPDRVSHGYWRFHQPEEYAPIDAAELAASRTRVEDSYRWVDAHLGQLVDQLGPETTIIVVSDHGFRADHGTIDGTHRKEGIFIAAGPGIRPDAARLDWSVLDVTPTVLAVLGLPVGADMDGRARTEVFDAAPGVAEIATWEASPSADDAASGRDVRIDATTEEQLRSLGYVE